MKTVVAPQNADAGTPPKPEEKKPLALTELTFEIVSNADVGEQDRLMKHFAGRVDHNKQDREKLKDESKYAAILLAGAELRVKRGIENKVYSATFTVSDLYKQVTGAKPPGHVYTLKCSFVSYVTSGFVTEAEWLLNRGNCLELAQKVADACIEKAPETGLQHEAVSRAANELKTRGDKEAKNLREILLSVKPAPKMTEEDALEYVAKIGEAMTCAVALAMMARIASSGNLPPCLSTIPDELKAMSDDGQKECYMALARSLQRTDAALGEKVDPWSIEASETTPNIKVITEAPVETPAADATTDTAESEPEQSEAPAETELAAA